MPTVSFDSKGFLLASGRGAPTRLPIVGASFDAALVEPDAWHGSLHQLRHVGFNTVVIRVPWLLHEPTAGRFVFTEACAIRRAVELAGGAGLRVMLRIGPCVGGGFARGGLPGWIHGVTGGRVREADPGFLSRVAGFWRALAPQVADLQATRNGNGLPRPIIAVGIEDDWRCLDAEVGAAYMSALVRFAREVGFDVPLFTANNGWYTHEGVIDAWQDASAIGRTAGELRQVAEDALPLLLHHGPAAAEQALESIAARADFVCEVVGVGHRGATSARGSAETPAAETGPMRRGLVFASTFGAVLAEMVPDIEAIDRSGRRVTTLRGPSGDRISISIAKDRVAFEGGGLRIADSRLGHCSGSLVALLGDIVVVAGAPRSRISVEVDGKTATLSVPAGDAAPRLTAVRGLRIAVVSEALAAGVGVAMDALEFVDRAGSPVARILRDGTVKRIRSTMARADRSRRISLTAVDCMVEQTLLDGTHARFAQTPRPASLGDLGVESMHGYHCARFTASARRNREVWVDGRGVAKVLRVAGRSRELTLVAESRADFDPRLGSHQDGRVGVVGPLREVGPLKGIKPSLVALPRFDATRIGRFAWGYDARSDAGERATARWTFAARTGPVIVRLPEWWISDGHARAGHAFRLNGGLVEGTECMGRDWFMLDGGSLSPMRPKPLAKGEKPPKAKSVKLEPGANELVLDLDPLSALDARTLKRLIADTRFLEVFGEIDARWWFARIAPPASWATASAVPRKPTGAPTWFRLTFPLEAPRAVEIVAEHAAGSVATVLVNGESAMVLDGASGSAGGTARRRMCTRRTVIPASRVRAGTNGINEILVFEPDGELPALTVR